MVCLSLYKICYGISRKVSINNNNTYVKPEMEEV